MHRSTRFSPAFYLFLLAFSAISLQAQAPLHAPPETDEEICKRIFTIFRSDTLRKAPVNEIVAAVGKEFLGTPYVAGVLDADSAAEHLIVNLRELDCVTFVENTLALARCIKKGQRTFAAFRKELQLIRYREAAISGYSDRLHYFTDWIRDNEEERRVQDVSVALGGTPLPNHTRFMTKNRPLYPKLAGDAAFAEMQKVEDALAKKVFHRILESEVPAIESQIQSGDILAITTNKKWLDVAHTGIALRTPDGTLRLLHASTTGKRVEISDMSLVSYLKKNRGHTGVIVVRVLEP